MDDMTAFERQVAGEFVRRAGPVRPVDAAAILAAVTAARSPEWRVQSLFSATKSVAAAAIVALFGGLLLAGVLTMPSEEQPPAVGASASPPVEPTDGPGFGPAGSFGETRRHGHHAVPLVDGRVLVVGGYYWDGAVGGVRYVAAAEVWDPETATFGPAGTLGEGRDGTSTTRLPDGRVLVVGGHVIIDPDTYPRGESDSYTSGEAQVWDPATESFHAAGSLEEGRWGHSATLLPDGRVLIVGGWDDGPIASAEVWDPETLAFGPAGSLNDARGDEQTAVLLPDGRVLVVGGQGPSTGPIASAEVWDPDTLTFSRAGALAETTPADSRAEARNRYTATLLQDGRVLFIGGGHHIERGAGSSYRDDRRAEIWDPETMSFGPGGALAEGRQDHTATLLPDGRVLVVGGYQEGVRPGQIASVEVWDPDTETFGQVGSLAEARAEHLATLLPDGRVLVVSGVAQRAGDDEIMTAELWDPDTGSFSPAGSLASRRSAHTATLLPDGRVLVIGPTATGGGSGRDPSGAEVWSP